MATIAVEKIPGMWDDARDIPFFRITARLFSPNHCLGASLLLATNDDEVDAAQPTPAELRTMTTAATVSTHTRPERGLVPARVRRTR